MCHCRHDRPIDQTRVPQTVTFQRLSRIQKRKRAADQRIDLLLGEQRKDLGKILAQWLRVFPVQHRDAVELAVPSAQARANENIGEHP